MYSDIEYRYSIDKQVEIIRIYVCTYTDTQAYLSVSWFEIRLLLCQGDAPPGEDTDSAQAVQLWRMDQETDLDCKVGPKPGFPI